MKRSFFMALLTVICSVFLGVIWCSNALAVSASIDCSEVRVKLSIGSVTSRTMTVKGTYALKESPTTAITEQKYTVKLDQGKLSLIDASGNPVVEGLSRLTFTPGSQIDSNQYITIPNSAYSDNIDYKGVITWTASGSSLMCVNTVYMEDYVKGVIPYEIGNSSHLEALKVQAVCARTYAAMQISPSSSYDLLDTSADQVYRGYDPSMGRSIQAVDATARQLLSYDGKLVQTYYSATNGGHTDIPQHIWSSRATLYPYHVCQEDEYDLRYTTENNRQTEVITLNKNALGLEDNVSKYIKDLVKDELKEDGFSVSLYSDITIKSIDKMANSKLRTGSKVGQSNQNHSIYAEEAGACPNYTGAKLTATVSAKLTDGSGNAVMKASKDNVVIRERTSNTSNAIGTVDEGYEFKVLKYDYSSGYHQVQYNGKTGYVNKNHVSFWADKQVTVEMDMLEFEKSGSYPVFSRTDLRLLTLDEKDDAYIIYHRRYGHGVGMSQYGVRQQAIEGRSHKQILSFYYPGTSLIDGKIENPSYTLTVDTKPLVTVAGIVAEDNVNIRSGPGTSYASYGRTTANQEFEITAMYYGDTWHQVWYEGAFAYIHTDYIAVKTEPQILADGVATGSLNLRAYPDGGFAAAKKLPKGTAVKVMGIGVPNSKWNQIWHEGRMYYVMSAYMEIAEEEKLRFGVAKGNLKLRASADSSLESTVLIPKGRYVKILEAHTPNSKWHKVEHYGEVYYALSNYTTLLDEEELPKTAVVAEPTQSVYVRKGPDTKYTSAGVLRLGNTVHVIVKNYIDGWHQVLYEGSLCYVNAAYLDTGEGDDPAPTPSVKPTVTPTATIRPTVTPTATVPPVPTPTVTAEPVPTDAAVVAKGTATSRLNLRLEPKSDAHVEVQLPKYSEVEITALNTPNNSWHQVLYDGALYYAMSKYIDVDEEDTRTTGIALATGNVNLRAEANSTAASVVKIPKGSYLEVVEMDSPNSKWHKINYNGKTYYGMSNYMSMLSGDESPVPVATMKCNATDVNVRAGNSTSTASMGKLSLNESVQVLKKNYDSSWHQVLYNGQLAYVYAIYLS